MIPPKDLQEKAEKVAWELTQKPSVYMKLVRVINSVALVIGKLMAMFKR